MYAAWSSTIQCRSLVAPLTNPLVRLFTLKVWVYDETYPTRLDSRLLAAVMSFELAPGSWPRRRPFELAELMPSV